MKCTVASAVDKDDVRSPVRPAGADRPAECGGHQPRRGRTRPDRRQAPRVIFVMIPILTKGRAAPKEGGNAHVPSGSTPAARSPPVAGATRR
jgi:hypothetical protein